MDLISLSLKFLAKIITISHQDLKFNHQDSLNSTKSFTIKCVPIDYYSSSVLNIISEYIEPVVWVCLPMFARGYVPKAALAYVWRPAGRGLGYGAPWPMWHNESPAP